MRGEYGSIRGKPVSHTNLDTDRGSCVAYHLLESTPEIGVFFLFSTGSPRSPREGRGGVSLN